MAAAVRQEPIADYFSTLSRRPQNPTISPSSFAWDQSPSKDPAALISSNSCDSILPSPNSPTLPFSNTYALPDPLEQKGEQAFNFGAFEDWMRWDDPADIALSPSPDCFPEMKLEPVTPNMGSLQLQNGASPTNISVNPSAISRSNIEDTSAVFGEDPMAEEPLFQSPSTLISHPLSDISPREGLYSTPLSWTRPVVGRHTPSNSNSYAPLSPNQESRLRDIAMPSQKYPTSPSSVSSPEPIEFNRRKRKSSIEDNDDEEEDSPPPSNGRHPPVKKTAHNMIEKRYRTNLNDKIAALKDSVPSLRVVTKKNSRGEEIQEDLQGLTPAHKLNKATVLSKATEYIAHLEKRNKVLSKENSALKSRVEAFEALVMSRPTPNQHSSPNPGQKGGRGNGRQGSGVVHGRGYLLDGMVG
jgi:hypothetical protein